MGSRKFDGYAEPEQVVHFPGGPSTKQLARRPSTLDELQVVPHYAQVAVSFNL